MNVIAQNFGPAPVPLIPESAPFTAEQRAWLNGFLAGLYGGVLHLERGQRLPGLRAELSLPGRMAGGSYEGPD